MVKRYEVVGDKYGDGTVKESETGQVVFYEDYAAFQQKLDAMAAENAALKQWANEADELWVNDCDLDSHLDSVPQTPATDAYLNSVRAEGVSISVAELKTLAQRSMEEAPNASGHIHASALYLMTIAESLRSGTHDTADKAG